MPGNKYHVCYLREVMRKHIPALSSRARSLITQAIDERLIIDPIGFGKPLRYSFKGLRRLRVSSYRIIYHVELKTKTVTIVAIQHQKDVYEDN